MDQCFIFAVVETRALKLTDGYSQRLEIPK